MEWGSDPFPPLQVQPRRKESLLTCLSDLFNSIATQKKKVGVIPPKKFISRLRKENGRDSMPEKVVARIDVEHSEDSCAFLRSCRSCQNTRLPGLCVENIYPPAGVWESWSVLSSVAGSSNFLSPPNKHSWDWRWGKLMRQRAERWKKRGGGVVSAGKVNETAEEVILAAKS